MRIKWTPPITTKFVEILVQYPCLYDASCPDYKNPNKKRSSLEALIHGMQMNNLDEDKAKNKIKNLQLLFDEETQKIDAFFQAKRPGDYKYLMWYHIWKEALEKNKQENCKTNIDDNIPKSQSKYKHVQRNYVKQVINEIPETEDNFETIIHIETEEIPEELDAFAYVRRSLKYDVLWNISNPFYNNFEHRLKAIEDLNLELGSEYSTETLLISIINIKMEYEEELLKIKGIQRQDMKYYKSDKPWFHLVHDKVEGNIKFSKDNESEDFMDAFTENYMEYNLLWDCENPNFNNDAMRQLALIELGAKFDMSPYEVILNVNHMKTKLNSELTKEDDVLDKSSQTWTQLLNKYKSNRQSKDDYQEVVVELVEDQRRLTAESILREPRANTNNVCQSCLRNGSDLFDMVEYRLDDKILLAELFLQLTQVDVTMSDEAYPKMVCVKCVTIMQEFFKFKEQVQQSQSILTKSFKGVVDEDSEMIILDSDCSSEEDMMSSTQTIKQQNDYKEKRTSERKVCINCGNRILDSNIHSRILKKSHNYHVCGKCTKQETVNRNRKTPILYEKNLQYSDSNRKLHHVSKSKSHQKIHSKQHNLNAYKRSSLYIKGPDFEKWQ